MLTGTGKHVSQKIFKKKGNIGSSVLYKQGNLSTILGKSIK